MEEGALQDCLQELRAKDRGRPRYNSNTNIGKRTGKVITCVGGPGDLSHLFSSFHSDISDDNFSDGQDVAPVKAPSLKGPPKRRTIESPPEFSSGDESDELEVPAARLSAIKLKTATSENVSANVTNDHTARQSEEQDTLPTKSFAHQSTQYSDSRPQKDRNVSIRADAVSQTSTPSESRKNTPAARKKSAPAGGSISANSQSNGEEERNNRASESRQMFQKILSSRKTLSDGGASGSEGLDVEVIDSRKPSPQTSNNLSTLAGDKKLATPNVIKDYTQMIQSQMSQSGAPNGSFTKDSSSALTPKHKQQGQIRRRLTFSENRRQSSGTTPVSDTKQTTVSSIHPVFELDVESGVSGPDEFAVSEVVLTQAKSPRKPVESFQPLKRRKSRDNLSSLSERRSSAPPSPGRTKKKAAKGSKRAQEKSPVQDGTPKAKSPQTAKRPRSSAKSRKSVPRRELEFSQVKDTKVQSSRKETSKVRYTLKSVGNVPHSVPDDEKSRKNRKSKGRKVTENKSRLVLYSSSDNSDPQTPRSQKKRILPDRHASFFNSYVESDIEREFEKNLMWPPKNQRDDGVKNESQRSYGSSAGQKISSTVKKRTKQERKSRQRAQTSRRSRTSDTVEKNPPSAARKSTVPKRRSRRVFPESDSETDHIGERPNKENDVPLVPIEPASSVDHPEEQQNENAASPTSMVQDQIDHIKNTTVTVLVEDARLAHPSVKRARKNLGRRTGPAPRSSLNVSKVKKSGKKRSSVNRSMVNGKSSVLDSWLQSGSPKKFHVPVSVGGKNKKNKTQEQTMIGTDQEEGEVTETHPPLPHVDESAITYSSDRPRVASRLPAFFGPPASTPRTSKQSKRRTSREPPAAKAAPSPPKRGKRHASPEATHPQELSPSPNKRSKVRPPSPEPEGEYFDDIGSHSSSNSISSTDSYSLNNKKSKGKKGVDKSLSLSQAAEVPPAADVTNDAGTSRKNVNSGSGTDRRSTVKKKSNRKKKNVTVEQVSINRTLRGRGAKVASPGADTSQRSDAERNDSSKHTSKNASADGTLVASDAERTLVQAEPAVAETSHIAQKPPKKRRGRPRKNTTNTKKTAETSKGNQSTATSPNMTTSQLESVAADSTTAGVKSKRRPKNSRPPRVKAGVQKRATRNLKFEDLLGIGPPKLTIPVPSPDAVARGLRRSTRVRCTPLHDYSDAFIFEPGMRGLGSITGTVKLSNEIIPVDLRNVDRSTIISALPGGGYEMSYMEEPTKKKKPAKKPPKKTKKQNSKKLPEPVEPEPPAPAVDDNQMSWYDNINEPTDQAAPETSQTTTRSGARRMENTLSSTVSMIEDTPMEIATPDNTLIVVKKTSIFRLPDNETFVGPTKEPVKPKDDLKVSKGISLDNISQGTLHLRPLMTKDARTIKSAHMCFFVHHGTVTVTVHETAETLTAGAYFNVPMMNRYSIYNPDRNVTAELFYTLVRQKPRRKNEEE